MTEPKSNVVGPWVEENPVECVLLVQRGSGPVPEVRRATTDDVAKAMGTTPAEVLRVQLDAEKDVTERFCRERNEAREALAKAEAWARRLNEDAERAALESSLVRRAAGCPLGVPLAEHVGALRKQMANDAAVIGQLKQQLEDSRRGNDALANMIQAQREHNAALRSEARNVRDAAGAKPDETTIGAVRRVVASKEGA